MCLYICSFFLLISCGSDKKGATSTAPAKNPANAAAAVPQGPTLPGIDGAVLSKLYNEAEHLDFLFFELPFSMNQSDKASIQSSLASFSPDPVGSIPPTCKPLARKMYQINGEIVEEFNVYYSQGCTFFVQMKDEKPFAACQMSQGGIDFFKKVLSQAMQTGQQQ